MSQTSRDTGAKTLHTKEIQQLLYEGRGRKAAWKGWLFREMEVLARRLEGKSIAALGGRRGAFGPLPRENRSSSLDI